MANETVWTGVVISEDGEILTTSPALGRDAVVDIRLEDGREGRACVIGRDDDIGLALLRPLLEPAGAYDYLALSGEPPSVGQQLELLQYSSFKPALDARTTRVVEYRPTPFGYGYILVDAAENTTADGAVLLDESGRMVGMRMPLLWLLQNQITNPGEVAAISAQEIVSAALPVLRSGRMHVRPVAPPTDPGFSPPPVPIIFHGEVTIGGVPASAGTLVYAKVSKEGLPDYWQSTLLGVAGEYVLPLSADTQTYLGGSVEFWVDCESSSTVATYEGFPGSVVEQAITF